MSKREAHQPSTKPVEFEPVSTEELRAACSKMAALVLAREDGLTPLSVVEDDGSVTLCEGDAPMPRPLQPYEGEAVVAHTVNMLQACGVSGIEVSVAEPLYDYVVEWLCLPPSKSPEQLLEHAEKADSFPAITAYDPQADLEATRAHANFEVFNLGYGTLMQARELARESGAESVIVIPCDLACFKPRHVLQLARALEDHPEAEVIASWAVWLNRPPYVLRASFLDGLEESFRCQPREGSSYRPMPQLNVHEVVFGEEMLMATPPASNPIGAFFGKCTLSALEAVRKVRAEQAEAKLAESDSEAAAKRKAATEEAAKRNAAYAGVSLPKSPSPADVLLMQTAREVVEQLDIVRGKLMDSGCALAKWDAWGQRNRLDFPIFGDRNHKNKLVYLDSAATTQRLGRALDAQYHFDAFENANIYRGAYELSAQSTAAFNEARAVVEKHIGADRRSLIFTANTSASAALVAQAWGEHNVEEGDCILVPAAEHHSNIVPWLMLAERKGARIEYIPPHPDGTLDMDAYRKLLQQRPKLVCVAQISNMLGLLNPVAEMAQAAREVGARIYVDAAQSFPHVAIDVRNLGIDFLGFSAHKVYGPMGLGCLWASPEAFDEMDPLVGGGGTVTHVGTDSYYLRAKAIQYELGTPAVSQAIGFAAALDYLDELGMAAVEEHSHTLTKFLVAGLGALNEVLGSVTIWGDHESDAGLMGLVAFSLAGIPAKNAASVLGKLGVCVRAGGHCSLPLHASLGLTGSVRFSFGIHTTLEDIEAGLVALALCRKIYDAQ